jgi:HK97 family phage major capsid protein
MEKADMQVADLINDGGYLPTERAARFVVDLIKESVLLKLIDVRGIKSHTQIIDKIGISGRVLRPGTSGVALPEADRTKPTTANVELTTRLMKGQIDLDDETIEDNIEQNTFKSTVMRMMSEAVAYDMDWLVANGDTSSADPFTALLDGMIVASTSHIVNAGTNPLAKSYLKDALKTMPSQYNRTKAKQRFLTSELAEIDYRDYVSDRATAMGDKYMQDDAPVRYANRPILGIPAFPDDLGGGSDSTSVLLLDPKNARWGIWRKVRVETGRDIEKGKWLMVVTVRAGFKYREEDAVVQITNVQTS